MIRYNDNLPYGLTLVNDRVIRKTAKLSTRQSFEQLEAICHHLMRHPDPTIVPIYDFQVLARPKTVFGWFEYQYDMMRLGMLNSDERNLIHNMSLRNYLELKHDPKIVSGRKNLPELYDFVSSIMFLNRYTDIHPGNILKDEQEQFRIIDLEGFGSSEPLDHPSNSWITR